MRYVVVYDVRAARRRTRVADLLLGYGRRVQLSAFECELSGEELQHVRRRLVAVLDPHEDRCRVFRICADCSRYAEAFGADLEAATGPVLVV